MNIRPAHWNKGNNTSKLSKDSVLAFLNSFLTESFHRSRNNFVIKRLPMQKNIGTTDQLNYIQPMLWSLKTPLIHTNPSQNSWVLTIKSTESEHRSKLENVDHFFKLKTHKSNKQLVRKINLNRLIAWYLPASAVGKLRDFWKLLPWFFLSQLQCCFSHTLIYPTELCDLVLLDLTRPIHPHIYGVEAAVE